MTESSNTYLGDSLFMFILFLLSSAVLFLVGLKTEFSYNYFRFSYWIDVAFVMVLAYLSLA